MTTDDARVQDVARVVVDDPKAELLDWSLESLGGGMMDKVGLVGGISIVDGSVISAGERTPWTAVRKRYLSVEVRFGDYTIDTHDPEGAHYWRREALAYADGILADLGPELVAPRCYGTHEDEDGITVWLERMDLDDHRVWSQSDYAVAAHALGRFNGLQLERPVLAQRPWFSPGRIPWWLQVGANGISALETADLSGVPAVWLDPATRARLLRQWRERDRLQAILARLPTTVCHHDATRRNLGVVASGSAHRVVAIDWQFMGTGAIGLEIAAMTSASLQFLDARVDEARSLGEAVVQSYIEGMRAAGWNGDRVEVELGYKAGSALLMGLAGAGVWFNGFRSGDMTDAKLETITGKPAAEIGPAWAQLQNHLLDLGDEALAMAETMR